MRVRSFWLCLTLIFSLHGAAETEAETHLNLDQLIDSVESYLADHYTNSGSAEIEISVNRLDPRLRLAPCDQALEYNVRDTGTPGGNVSVHTRCPGTRPWALYISAAVKVMEAVVIANRNIPKGALLSLQDFDTQLRDTSKIASNYVLDAGQLIGKATSRTIRAGEAMRFALVTEPIAVKRGDTIVVEAQSGAIMVSTQAVALADGRVGDQISVRNPQSERVVRVEIMGPGRGKVML